MAVLEVPFDRVGVAGTLLSVASFHAGGADLRSFTVFVQKWPRSNYDGHDDRRYSGPHSQIWTIEYFSKMLNMFSNMGNFEEWPTDNAAENLQSILGDSATVRSARRDFGGPHGGSIYGGALYWKAWIHHPLYRVDQFPAFAAAAKNVSALADRLKQR